MTSKVDIRKDAEKLRYVKQIIHTLVTNNNKTKVGNIKYDLVLPYNIWSNILWFIGHQQKIREFRRTFIQGRVCSY